MGKRKIEMVEIDDEDKRMVTFFKKYKGLFKKAADICSLCDALNVFSPAGKPYSFGHPSVDALIDRFLTVTIQGGEEVEENKNMKNTTDGFWWDTVDMEELDSKEKLQAMKIALIDLKQNILKRLEKLTSSSSSSSPTVVYTDSVSYAVKPSSLDHHQNPSPSPSPSPTMILDNAAPLPLPMMMNGSDFGNCSSWLLDDDDLPNLVDYEAGLNLPLDDDDLPNLVDYEAGLNLPLDNDDLPNLFDDEWE